MRRLLAILILCLSVFVGGAWGATYTVCASGCDAVSVTGALSLCAASGDSVSILPSYNVIGEAVTVTKNVMIYGATGNRWKHQPTPGTALGYAATISAGSSIVGLNFENCGVVSSVEGVLVDRCTFNSSVSATSATYVSNLNASNCVGMNTAAGDIRFIGASATYPTTILNCSVSGFAIGLRATQPFVGKNILFWNNVQSATSTGAASNSMITSSAANTVVSTWGAGCVSFSGSPFYQTPTADNPWTWRTGPWFPGNFAGEPLPTVPEVATQWYDASAGTETAPMTQGVSDGVTYIYSTTANSGYKSFTVTVPEAGTYKLSASVSAPDASHNAWSVRIGGATDVKGVAWDGFLVAGIGQGFHEEDVTGSSGTRYWSLAAGTAAVAWNGARINTALACFRLVRVGDPDILGRVRRVPNCTIGAVEYYPRPVPDDPFRWDE